MRRMRAAVVVVGVAFAAGGSAAAQQSGPAPGHIVPAWAYPVNPPAAPGGGPAPAVAPDPGKKTLPGSSASFTLAEVRDAFNVADWFPGDHAPMTDIIAKGRRPDVRGCGFCHMPNGLGRPENASLAGLPAAYIVQQMADYRAGLRKSSEPRMGPPAAMLAIGKAATDAEARAAAEYFASLKTKPWIKVIETRMVPRTRAQGGMLVVVEGGAMEPIGDRIIETPEHLERTELRDPTAPFLAYVPQGAVQKGRQLATTGGKGRTVACGTCHGPELKGLGPVPGLAGRSPSYIARQLWDMKNGTRAGLWSPLMRDATARLTEADIVSIAAYTASLAP